MKSSGDARKRNRLERHYGSGHLHFITCSCYRRLPFLGTARARNLFLKVLNEVRERYDFGLYGYVVMPEHIHLLISEPKVGTPSVVLKVLKQRVSRRLRSRTRRRVPATQGAFAFAPPAGRLPQFWQRRFYDFNVWSARKKNEKLNYMHFNPVQRGLVRGPGDWMWSSCRFYWKGEKGLCPPNPEWEYPKPRNRTFLNPNVRHPPTLAAASYGGQAQESERARLDTLGNDVRRSFAAKVCA